MRTPTKVAMLAVVVLLVTLISGCAQLQETTSLSTDSTHLEQVKRVIQVETPDHQLTFDRAAYDAFEQQTIKTTHINTRGDQIDVDIVGIDFIHYLSEQGISSEDIAAITVHAADGYQITIARAMWQEQPFMLISQIDGQSLTNLQTAIPGQRAMFWVRDVDRLVVTTGAKQRAQSPITDIYFFKEASKALSPHRLNNVGFMTNAYSLREFFEAVDTVGNTPVLMVARDGLQKTEMANVFYDQYITYEQEAGSDEDVPLYFSEAISDGMRVKALDYAIADGKAIYFGDECQLASLLKSVDMIDSDSYTFIAADGFAVDIPKTALANGRVAINANGELTTEFHDVDVSAVRGKGSIRQLVQISATRTEDKEVATSQTDKDLAFKLFVNGKGVPVDMATIKALPQVEKTLSFTTRKGKTVSGIYRGFHWTALAEAMKFDPRQSITIVAADGYEMTLSAEIINHSDSLFALTVNGDSVATKDNAKLWFCAAEAYTANHWVKYITKIIVGS